jgi:hypothetical protein
MPYAYVEPDIYLEYEGVAVWHIYDAGDGGAPLEYWFTTDITSTDDFHGHGERGQFDVRLLAARWSETPTVGEWDSFWKPRWRREAECIEVLIQEAIDAGRLPHQSRTRAEEAVAS